MEGFFLLANLKSPDIDAKNPFEQLCWTSAVGAILWAMSENPDMQVRQVEALERIANALEGILKQQERIAFAQESHPEVKRAVELKRTLSKMTQTKRP